MLKETFEPLKRMMVTMALRVFLFLLLWAAEASSQEPTMPPGTSQQQTGTTEMTSVKVGLSESPSFQSTMTPDLGMTPEAATITKPTVSTEHAQPTNATVVSADLIALEMATDTTTQFAVGTIATPMELYATTSTEPSTRTEPPTVATAMSKAGSQTQSSTEELTGNTLVVVEPTTTATPPEISTTRKEKPIMATIEQSALNPSAEQTTIAAPVTTAQVTPTPPTAEMQTMDSTVGQATDIAEELVSQFEIANVTTVPIPPPMPPTSEQAPMPLTQAMPTTSKQAPTPPPPSMPPTSEHTPMPPTQALPTSTVQAAMPLTPAMPTTTVQTITPPPPPMPPTSEKAPMPPTQAMPITTEQAAMPPTPAMPTTTVQTIEPVPSPMSTIAAPTGPVTTSGTTSAAHAGSQVITTTTPRTITSTTRTTATSSESATTVEASSQEPAMPPGTSQQQTGTTEITSVKVGLSESPSFQSTMTPDLGMTPEAATITKPTVSTEHAQPTNATVVPADLIALEMATDTTTQFAVGTIATPMELYATTSTEPSTRTEPPTVATAMSKAGSQTQSSTEELTGNTLVVVEPTTTATPPEISTTRKEKPIMATIEQSALNPSAEQTTIAAPVTTAQVTPTPPTAEIQTMDSTVGQATGIAEELVSQFEIANVTTVPIPPPMPPTSEQAPMPPTQAMPTTTEQAPVPPTPAVPTTTVQTITPPPPSMPPTSEHTPMPPTQALPTSTVQAAMPLTPAMPTTTVQTITPPPPPMPPTSEQAPMPPTQAMPITTVQAAMPLTQAMPTTTVQAAMPPTPAMPTTAVQIIEPMPSPMITIAAPTGPVTTSGTTSAAHAGSQVITTTTPRTTTSTTRTTATSSESATSRFSSYDSYDWSCPFALQWYLL
ncbi:mucin-2-like [Pleurodeles waltl]|uniref:mucin-2-like n=1 Tax=Pleurodeles waltl TaxID=8319 RepID=UPI00370994DC